MRPKIQLALDCDNTEQAIKACQGGVVDEVDIIETGYCLIASEEMFLCFADLKVLDSLDGLLREPMEEAMIFKRSFRTSSSLRMSCLSITSFR